MTKEQWQDRVSRIASSFYVGEVAVRSYGPWLAELGIDTVVSVLTAEQHVQFDASHPVPPGLTHRRFFYGDSDTIIPGGIDAVLGHFGRTTLIHCVSGSNRSTAIALCRLMANENMGIVQAFSHYMVARGEKTSKTYAVVPRMSCEMQANVARWITAKGVRP